MRAMIKGVAAMEGAHQPWGEGCELLGAGGVVGSGDSGQWSRGRMEERKAGLL